MSVRPAASMTRVAAPDGVADVGGHAGDPGALDGDPDLLLDLSGVDVDELGVDDGQVGLLLAEGDLHEGAHVGVGLLRQNALVAHGHASRESCSNT